jgi:single-strand DNA-binding protein
LGSSRGEAYTKKAGMINAVAIEGKLARPADLRVLPSGTRALGLEVTVRRGTGPAESVPVTWLDAPAWASSLDTADPVVVVGRVRRRFFRAGGATQSRTEVVADVVVRATATGRARRALTALSATIEAAAADLGR